MALHNQRLDCFDLLRASVCLRVCVCCRCSTMWLIIAGTVGERETNSSSVAEGGKTERKSWICRGKGKEGKTEPLENDCTGKIGSFTDSE